MNRRRIAIATLVAASSVVVATGLRGPVAAPAAAPLPTSAGGAIGTSAAPTAARTAPAVATTTTVATVPRVSVPVKPGPGQSGWRVMSGESIYSIARKFAMTPEQLVSMNGWAEGMKRVLYVGDVILVKTPPSTTTSTTTTTAPPPPPPTAAPEPAPAPVVTPRGCAAARDALVSAGATTWEINFGLRIAKRESGCTLTARNYSDRTRDDSWGPWQINYYGSMRAGMTKLVGSPESNIASWSKAAKNFLRLLHAVGACAWQPPRYCAG